MCPLNGREGRCCWLASTANVRELTLPLVDFRARTIDDQVSLLNERMSSVNDVLLGRRRQAKPSKVKWWTRELTTMRRHVRRLRRRFQRARRVNAEDLAQRKSEFLAALSTYKDELSRSKEDNWRRFVRDNGDDPWGIVYRAGMAGLRDRLTYRGCVAALRQPPRGGGERRAFVGNVLSGFGDSIISSIF